MAKTRLTSGAIGDVKPSMLTTAQFLAENGPGWVLADGSSCVGSSYHAKSGNSVVPDLRGVILRGKNNGRADGNQNPDGDLALGTFQSHATAKNGLAISDGGHRHRFYEAGAQGAIKGVAEHLMSNDANPSFSTGNLVQGPVTDSANVSLGAGDAETRMRNVTVNNFIKIN